MDRLYFSCMRFCESFFHYLREKEKIRNDGFCDDYTRDKIMEFERDRLRNSYNGLVDNVKRCEKELGYE